MIDIDVLLDNIDACIFDMDGTLIDSLWVWSAIDIECLSKYGIDEDPKTYQKAISGMSFIQVAQMTKDRYDLPMSVEELMDEWNMMAEDKYAHEIPYKPGAEAFLKELKKRGIKTGIGTSNSRHLVEQMYPRLHLDKYISVILTGDEITNGKPEPDIYLEAAAKLGVDPSHCLVFEDVLHGITAGHAAGMKVCTVYDDNTAYCDDEKRERAEFYIRDYLDVTWEHLR